MNKYLILWSLLSLFNSCKISKSLRELSRTKIKTHHYALPNQDILFIPLHHLGKKKFYDDLTQTVTQLKQDGYRVYYEKIKFPDSMDSLAKDSLKRKVRRFLGFSGSYRENIPIFKKMIQQPPYHNLGVDTLKDIRADVTMIELLNEFEKKYRAIVLDSIDWNTPLNQSYHRLKYPTKKEWHEVAIVFRNKRLIEEIKTQGDPKVLILYGEGHRKNFQEQIKLLK